jgi:hypothetical protein
MRRNFSNPSGGRGFQEPSPLHSDSGGFPSREISVVIRLFGRLQFIDPVKNSVDLPSSEFAIYALEIKIYFTRRFLATLSRNRNFRCISAIYAAGYPAGWDTDFCERRKPVVDGAASHHWQMNIAPRGPRQKCALALVEEVAPVCAEDQIATRPSFVPPPHRGQFI